MCHNITTPITVLSSTGYLIVIVHDITADTSLFVYLFLKSVTFVQMDL